MVSTVTRMPGSGSEPAAALRLENRHTGEVLTMRRLSVDGRAVLHLRGSLPPHREGPPMHIHYLEDEVVEYVTAGRLAAEIGGRRVAAGPGETVQLPRGVPHRWWNGGDEPLEFEGHVHPVEDFDRYLQGVFDVVNASASGRPSLFYLAQLVLRHRRTQAVLMMPPPVQMVLFRLVVAIGTVLGHYRGTDWPGCPARCTGAPSIE